MQVLEQMIAAAKAKALQRFADETSFAKEEASYEIYSFKAVSNLAEAAVTDKF